VCLTRRPSHGLGDGENGQSKKTPLAGGGRSRRWQREAGRTAAPGVGKPGPHLALGAAVGPSGAVELVPLGVLPEADSAVLAMLPPPKPRGRERLVKAVRERSRSSGRTAAARAQGIPVRSRIKGPYLGSF